MAGSLKLCNVPSTRSLITCETRSERGNQFGEGLARPENRNLEESGDPVIINRIIFSFPLDDSLPPEKDAREGAEHGGGDHADGEGERRVEAATADERGRAHSRGRQSHLGGFICALFPLLETKAFILEFGDDRRKI